MSEKPEILFATLAAGGSHVSSAKLNHWVVRGNALISGCPRLIVHGCASCQRQDFLCFDT